VFACYINLGCYAYARESINEFNMQKTEMILFQYAENKNDSLSVAEKKQ
jgi:hypothetical protein